MTFGQDLSTALAELRVHANSGMPDTFTPYQPTGMVTGADRIRTQDYTALDPVPGKLQSRALTGNTETRTVQVAGQDARVVEGGLHIPVTSDAPAAGPVGVGWEYELTTPGPDTPPELVGSRWLVVDAPAKSHMTARRLDVVRLR